VRLLTRENVTDKVVNVTDKIDKFLWRFPRATPKEVCNSLGLPYGDKKRSIKGYGHMVATRKNLLKKYIGSEVKGRLPKPLLSAHRVEWEIERGVPVDKLLRLRVVAERCRPRLEDPRPVGAWYVIPNRNKQLEYHDEFVSIRVFPGTGTCRIQPSKEMDYKELSEHVWEAFLNGGLFSKECDELLLHLEVGPRHKTFRVGPVTPFKIDYYKESVGLVFQADGTHPCLLPGSLVVTKNGLKPIESVCSSDEVLTHKGRFMRVIQTMSREYDGHVVTIHPRYGLPSTLTVEHPVYATNVRKGHRSVRARGLKWTPSGTISKGDFVSFPIISRHAIPAKAFCSRRFNQYSSSKREVFKLAPDLLRLIGYYLGDGSRTSHMETKILLGKNQQAEALDIQQIVEKHFGSSVRVTSDGNMLVVVFCHAPFQRYLTEVFGSSALLKHMPLGFLQLSQEHKIGLLKGLFGSDGSHGLYKGYFRYSFATTSPDLAIKMVQLLLSLNLFASINRVNKVGQKRVSEKLPKGVISRNPCYNIIVNGLSASKLHEVLSGSRPSGTTNNASFNLGFFSHRPDTEILESGKRYRYRLNHYAMIPVYKVIKGHYRGPVFNLRVEEDDSYCLPYLTVHNCHVEGIETWPSWTRPLIQSNYKQTEAQQKQTEAITMLTEQMRLHLSVLAGINENFKLNVGATQDLKIATAALAKVLGVKVKERRKAPKRLMEFGQRALTDYK